MTSAIGITGTSIALTLRTSARASASSSTIIPCGSKMTSTSTGPSHAFSSQPSGGRSVRRPASASVASARSASSGLTIRSRSWIDSGPPRAHAATPPPTMKGTSSSRSAAAHLLSVSRMSSSCGEGSAMAPLVSPDDGPGNPRPVSEGPCVRIAAAGDIHVDRHNRDAVAAAFAALDDAVDLVLIAGDLTTHGEPEQGELFVTCRHETDLPVIAVLGNHDWHVNRHDELVAVLREGDIEVLEGTSWIGTCDGVEVGVAGTKGFVGGFEGSFQPDFGEPSLRALYRETGAEVEALDRALEQISGCGVRIALMHYSPVRDTLAGEPEGIYTFLGSGRLAEPLVHHRPDMALHGHAHAGMLEGSVAGLVPVYNVAVPVMKRDF